MPPADSAANEAKLAAMQQQMEQQLAHLRNIGLKEKELEEAKTSGLSIPELVETCELFRRRLVLGSSECGKALTIEDVDILLRQLRLFLAVRFLWALFMEIDKNVNGKIEINEFIQMVAMLRGRHQFSGFFYLRALPRAVMERYCKVFVILAGEGNDMLNREQLVTAVGQLNGHVDTDSEDFKRALQDINPEANSSSHKWGLQDFLVLQAKLRKQPPEFEVALLSLTDDEFARFAGVFHDWRGASKSPASPVELRMVLGQLGHPMPLDQVKRQLVNIDLDGSRTIELREFLYILVNLGAGTSQRKRSILLPGASYEDAYEMRFPLEELWELGYEDLQQIRKAGWSAHSIVKAGLAEPWQLRQVGYSAGELRKIGCSAKQLKLAGYSFEELRNSGYSSEAIQECCAVLSKNRACRSSEESEITLRPMGDVGPTGVAMLDQGAPHGPKRWWSTPRIKATLDGQDFDISNVKARPITT